MMQALAFVALLLVAGSALYFAQHPARQDAVSANALVDFAADWQHDITRAPMHLTRISDVQETRIGDRLRVCGQHGQISELAHLKRSAAVCDVQSLAVPDQKDDQAVEIDPHATGKRTRLGIGVSVVKHTMIGYCALVDRRLRDRFQ
jgi:hypothetical protein